VQHRDQQIQERRRRGQRRYQGQGSHGCLMGMPKPFAKWKIVAITSMETVYRHTKLLSVIGFTGNQLSWSDINMA
jgi:hypothetical protein